MKRSRKRNEGGERYIGIKQERGGGGGGREKVQERGRRKRERGRGTGREELNNASQTQFYMMRLSPVLSELARNY